MLCCTDVFVGAYELLIWSLVCKIGGSATRLPLGARCWAVDLPLRSTCPALPRGETRTRLL